MGLLEILKANEGKTAEELVDVINKDFLPKNFVSKEQYDKKNTRLSEVEAEFQRVSTEMTELSKTSGIAEELRGKLSQVETDFTEYKNGVETQRTNEKKSYAIRAALAEHGAIDDLLEHKIDLSKVIFDADNSKILDGFSPQIETLKTEKPHLFKTTEVKDPSGVPPSKHEQAQAYDQKLLARMGVTQEQMEKYHA